MIREKNILLKCFFCKSNFLVDKCHSYQKYCSINCRNTNFRKLNPNKVKEYKKRERRKNFEKYRTNNEIYHDKVRFGGNRRKVMERDKFTCINCSRKYPYVNLVVHHIDGNNKKHVIDNLKTLCRSCHAKEHRNI
jgi:5-methylcytosine-specific restriction endonuclease McrA